jgi:hypothetical protein
MAEETGYDWSSLIPILAGVVTNLAGGGSLTGKPRQQVSTVGPLTPEGQKIMDEYSRTVAATPMMTSTSMGNVRATFPNKSRIGLLKQMALLDAARRGTLEQQPAEEGVLGRLAPLLASMYSNKRKDPWGGIKPTVNYNAGNVGYDPNFTQNPDDWWMNSFGTSEGE